MKISGSQKLPGPAPRYTIGLYIKNRAGKFVAISPCSVATRAANRLPGTARLTPKPLVSCRSLEKEKSKNGRSLVHFSVPSSLAIWKLRGCTSCLAPSRAPSNHAAAQSNLILPGGGVGASRCDTVATALGKVRASTVVNYSLQNPPLSPLPPSS